MEPETKWCPGCEKTKPVGEFSKNKRMTDGLQRRCRDCIAEYQRAWREANPNYFHVAILLAAVDYLRGKI